MKNVRVRPELVCGCVSTAAELSQVENAGRDILATF
jgi:hypothetical protein